MRASEQAFARWYIAPRSPNWLIYWTIKMRCRTKIRAQYQRKCVIQLHNISMQRDTITSHTYRTYHWLWLVIGKRGEEKIWCYLLTHNMRQWMEIDWVPMDIIKYKNDIIKYKNETRVKTHYIGITFLLKPFYLKYIILYSKKKQQQNTAFIFQCVQTVSLKRAYSPLTKHLASATHKTHVPLKMMQIKRLAHKMNCLFISITKGVLLYSN